MSWHNKGYTEAIHEFSTDIDLGLTNTKAEEAMEQYGPNKLEEAKGTSLLTKFFMQFNDFMIFILLIAAGVSAGMSVIQGENDFLDPVIILLIVILNAILGVAQEYKAEKAIEALKQMSAPRSRVIRSGKTLELDTIELVPGDIIVLKAGDMVPADARLFEAINMKAEESALTGESHSVEKDAHIKVEEQSPIGDRHNMVYAGTIISSGRGKAIVVDTGMETEMGKIADLIMRDEAPQTPLQKKLAETGKILGLGALIICGIIFLIGVLQKISPFFMFMTSVSLAVAAIPEGLPAIVTIMLAIGVQRMAKRKAVIRKLPAVETLGSASVICSDKTGTLTQNKMRVVEVCDKNGVLGRQDHNKRLILQYASLCNDSVMAAKSDGLDIQGDPTETAIVAAAYEMFMSKNDIDGDNPRIMEIPFDSKRKLMTTIHKTDAGYMVITKGAVDVLIDKCGYYSKDGVGAHLDFPIKKEILKTNDTMAEKALRVIGVACKQITDLPRQGDTSIEKDLVFMGLIGMMDPPRPEVASAVATCRKAGIKAVMVTGDHVITAKAIAHKLGIMKEGDKAMTGTELNKLDQEGLENVIGDYTVFARVSPEHKVRIVKAFQATGNVVAMTGDGVNDAPALKAADIGCAMGITGTDVAKGAADMILMDDNFATIVDAVKEGRGIYCNIKKAIHFLLSSNIGEIITIFVAILMGWEMPLIAIQLLWVNLITDSLPAIALGLDPAEDEVMLNKPFPGGGSFFSGGLWKRIGLEGAMIGMLALIAFGVGKVYFDAPESFVIGRTMCFATLSISQLVHAFNMRSEKSIFAIHILDNIYLVGAFLVGVTLQVGVITIPTVSAVFKTCPLQSIEWGIVALLCIVPVMVVELEKFATLPKTKKSRKRFTFFQEA